MIHARRATVDEPATTWVLRIYAHPHLDAARCEALRAEERLRLLVEPPRIQLDAVQVLFFGHRPRRIDQGRRVAVAAVGGIHPDLLDVQPALRGTCPGSRDAPAGSVACSRRPRTLHTPPRPAA